MGDATPPFTMSRGRWRIVTALVVVWADGSTAVVTWYGGSYVVLDLAPAEIHSGHLEGLLGDADGDAGNDLRLAGGAPVEFPPSYGALYPSFADSWRSKRRKPSA